MTLRSHLDGSEQRLTPERAMQIQALLGSDIAMAFDDCPPSDAPRGVIEAAMARTTRWARPLPRAPRAAPGQLRFGIVQGGMHVDLRRAHLAEMRALRSTASLSTGSRWAAWASARRPRSCTTWSPRSRARCRPKSRAT